MPPLLSADDRLAVVSRISRYVREQSLKRCAIILHGGEPLLLGSGAIADFARQLRAAIGAQTAVDVGLQTNGLLLTDAVLATLEQENIGISLSLDGPREANDLHRNSRRGRSSFLKALAALDRLKTRPVFRGIIAVIDPRTRPETLFEFFESHQPPKIDFLLPDAHHLRPPPGRDANTHLYCDWLVSAFDLWFDHYPHLPVRTFEAILDAAAGLPSGTDAFGLGDVSLLSIETDGTYHDLDVLKVVADGATRLVGSVRDSDIATVAASEAIARHRKLLSKAGLCATCRSCPEIDICGGGSLPHRYGPQGFDHPTVYCHEMQALVGHVRTRLKQALCTAVPAVELRPLPKDFEISRYELAETASASMADLCQDAEAQYAGQLLQTLRAIDEHHPDLRRVVATIRGANDNALRRLASRPGTVAWQRTFTDKAAGRIVYSVDGLALDPDLSYLASLHEALGETANMRIAADDRWLRAPFGNAIIFEPAEVAQSARAVVQAALEIVETWRPALARELRTLCRDIQFVRDPEAHPEKIVSFSDNVVPGALFVSVTQGQRLVDPYDLADSLIHEHRHQKLYLLERLRPMVEPTEMKVVSPWREDLRPPSGLVHALFVFVELRRFWDHVLRRGPQDLNARAIAQLRETDANLDEGLRTLQSCPLTASGRELAVILHRTRERFEAPA